MTASKDCFFLTAIDLRQGLTDCRSGKEWDVDIEGAYYQSHNSSGGVASGAYIFRPDGQYRNAGAFKTATVHGPVLTEVRFVSLLSPRSVCYGDSQGLGLSDQEKKIEKK